MLIAGCVQPPVMSGGSADEVRYAYVVLGDEGRPIARVITAATTCPAIEIDGLPQPMDVRARPAIVPQRPTRFAAADSKPSAFPLLVCEKPVPAGVARAAIGGRTLPLPKPDVQRIVVIGDTGCRLSILDDRFQDCNDPAAWPFRAVADAAADFRPDLVLHVGDDVYRENACPPSDAGCAGSPWGYGWDTWEADLFAPAARLLAAAPWVVVRGNHETCARAGQGWRRFLDPRPLAARGTCDDAADDPIGDYSEPYAVPFRSGSALDTQFIVFDSSAVGITPLAASDPMYRNYRAQFERAFALAARRPGSFFVNHHPVLAFESNPGKPDSPYPGNAGLQSVLTTLQPVSYFPASIHALLNGHVHLFEVVSFATPQPAQFVSGNGGDWAPPQLPNPLPAAATPAPGAVVEHTVSTNAFGFMTIEPDGSQWKMVARDVRGVPMTTCTLFERRATCDPVPLR
jgi:hypothetical protein